MVNSYWNHLFIFLLSPYNSYVQLTSPYLPSRQLYLWRYLLMHSYLMLFTELATYLHVRMLIRTYLENRIPLVLKYCWNAIMANSIYGIYTRLVARNVKKIFTTKELANKWTRNKIFHRYCSILLFARTLANIQKLFVEIEEDTSAWVILINPVIRSGVQSFFI